MPRVVFYPVAVADLADHRKVIIRAALEALMLEEHAAALKIREPLRELSLYIHDRAVAFALRRHIVLRRKNKNVGDIRRADNAGQRVNDADTRDALLGKLNTKNGLLVRRHNLNRISHGAKSPWREVGIGALEIDAHELPHKRGTAERGTARDPQMHFLILRWTPEAVDTGNRRDDDYIAARE